MNAHDHTMTIQTIELKIDVHAHLYKTVNRTAKQSTRRRRRRKRRKKYRKMIHSQSVEEKSSVNSVRPRTTNQKNIGKKL